MQITENNHAVVRVLTWIAANQQHKAGSVLLVSASVCADLKALAGAFVALTGEAEKLDTEIAALKAKLAKRGRKPANGTAQTGTERSRASRERKARIEAPLKAEIKGLKAQITALEADIKTRK